MMAPSDEPTPKRRKVRKGTHSCWECRQRKVKCTFSSLDDAICINCHRRGTKCTSQAVLDGPEMAESDTGDAEQDAVINTRLVGESGVCSQPDTTVGCLPSTPFSIHPTPASSVHGKEKNASSRLQTLESSSQLRTPQLPPAPVSIHGSVSEVSAYPSITQALRSSLPPQKDIEILLESLSGMSIFCYKSSFELCSSWPSEKAEQQIPTANLLYSESHPVLLARQILLLVVGLQHLSPTKAIPGLTKHHRAIMEQLADSAIKLVNTNDVLLSTLEALENLILEGFYHIDRGNIRRAWITMRRAVMTAQLLGLHRPGHYRFKVVNQQSDLDPAAMWACVVSTEQFLCLLLGLPTSTSGPIRNGINGFGQVFVLAAAYYVGTEIVSVAAGESKNPQRDVPRATNSILYRILFVFIGMSFFQGLICPSTSDDLVHPASKTASSPFTIGFMLAGWKSSGHFVNAIILIAFISAANGVIYIQSRTLYSLALKRKAPSFFAITNARGVPYPAIIFSNMWGFLGLMSLQTTAGSLFSYFTSFGGTAAYIAWAAITFVQLRVRAAAKKQGIDAKEFPFKAPGHILIYWGNLFFNIFLLLIQGFTVFEAPFDYKSFIASYISILVFFLMFIGYKWWFKSKWVSLDQIHFPDRLTWSSEDPDKTRKRSWGRRLLEILKE
ncbi:Fungal transcriptional regulatory protein, N-terminal [Penicillium camemberti]|uniref:Fungal transcriptional regulatory protein, N-terminal n=1 Tax=Penicillium camemberti (strain FM 013) TaxID=1429867 RepID=A0A0G4PRM9_PENC3|nr:Fungal transcriptional regulatory protein, N-terminal [Penicillium camemberti]